MEQTVIIHKVEFDEPAFNRLRKLAITEGVPDDKCHVIRWAAMQFLNIREGRSVIAAQEPVAV